MQTRLSLKVAESNASSHFSIVYVPFELHLSLWRCYGDCLESSENVNKHECKNKKQFELFSMVRKIFCLITTIPRKIMHNEIFAFLATKQSVIQVRMHNTDLGQSVN